jgi:hypothetical protein
MPSNMLRSCHGDDEGLDSEILQKTKLGPVGGNYQGAGFSPILEHANNCRYSSVEGAAFNSGKLPKWGHRLHNLLAVGVLRGRLGFMTSKDPSTPKIN